MNQEINACLLQSVTYVCPGGAISSELLDLCQQCIEDIGCVRCPFRVNFRCVFNDCSYQRSLSNMCWPVAGLFIMAFLSGFF
jgi:hypothetical protein